MYLIIKTALYITCQNRYRTRKYKLVKETVQLKTCGVKVFIRVHNYSKSDSSNY